MDGRSIQSAPPKRHAKPVIGRSAIVSPCGRYRYALGRQWGPSLHVVLFVGLNPSTADAVFDDATVRKLIGFTRKWGFDGFRLVNLFGYRATSPAELRRVADPIGPHNDTHLEAHLRTSAKVIACWGCSDDARCAGLINRARMFDSLIRSIGHDTVQCLGRTVEGFPMHPLRLAYDTPLVEYFTEAEQRGLRSPLWKG